MIAIFLKSVPFSFLICSFIRNRIFLLFTGRAQKLKYALQVKWRSEESLSESEFGLAAVYRIIKKSGAERVSDEAAEELRRVVEEIASQVAKQAIELSVHAGRHTVKVFGH